MPTIREILLSIKAANLANWKDWQGRLAVWVAGAAVGLVVVVFAKLTVVAIDYFFSLQKSYWWLPLILTPLGGALIVWLTRRWFSGAQGSGIPQTIATLHSHAGERLAPVLISLKLVAGKIMLGLFGLGVGFSAGREGPSVQIGAGVMYAFRRFIPAGSSIEPRHMILAGGAAGISAAFNTPLAGVVFAIEELGRTFEQKNNGVVITAIVLAGLVSISIEGNYTYFGNLSVGKITGSIIPPIVLCGLVCGVLGGLFSLMLIRSSQARGGFWKIRSLHPVAWAAGCGMLVALLGLVSNGAAHGSGYTFTREMLAGSAVEPWLYAPVKYMATILTYLSGIPGGIFAPALAIGAGIGNDLMMVFGGQHLQGAICALCMAGFLAAVTQAPITSFIIVMEMIDGHEMVISLMAVALLATIVSRILSPPLYATLAEQFADKN